MKIALGADHAGAAAKDSLARLLSGAGHEVEDCGTDGETPVDYPDYALMVAQRVADGSAERGILVCGTGIGMSIAANKVAGIRAAKCNDPQEAVMCRAHNNANILCMGARILDATVLAEVAQAFIDSPFEGGRHARRVDKMMDAESSPSG